MRLFFSLLLIGLIPSYAISAPIAEITPEKKVVVEKFNAEYFEDTKFFKSEGDITVGTFLKKNQVEQDVFVFDWAIKKRDQLQQREVALNNEILVIQAELAELNNALKDWNP